MTAPVATASLCVLATGSDESEGDFSIRVYPNPVRDKLLLPDDDFEKWSIHDVSGTNVYGFSSTTNNTAIDCSQLHPGVYVLQIFLQNGTSHCKFVVVRQIHTDEAI